MSSVRPALATLALLLLAAPSRADTLKVPAQFETIQAAVDAASPGDIVQVAKGTYAENVVVVTPDVALRGKGATIDGRYDGWCVFVVADDVEVSGFTLVNGGGLAEGDSQGGLFVDGDGALLSKLDVRACFEHGLFLFGTGVVEKCTVDGVVGTGILVDTDNALGEAVTEVSKNTVTRCFTGVELHEGPFQVEKNVVEDNLSDGLVLDIQPIFAEGFPVIPPTTIVKNECRRNAGAGFEADKFSGPDLEVEKNVFAGNGTGVNLEGFDFRLANNTIDDNLSGGVVLFTEGADLLDNKVRGNGFFGLFVAGTGPFAEGGVSGSNLVQDCIIQDNGGDGVHVVSDTNTIVDNTVKGNLGDGIQVVEGVLANDVEENSVTGNGHDGIDNSGLLTHMHGNVCKDNGGADLAGIGNGAGTVNEHSDENETGDGTDLASPQELELATIF